ncbi:winged helix-turn-helix transcriptional regulator [Brevibacterium atlanticum]|uniref:winged helix-turn-helix transcriptional regulator n=1 Tax=Brevibacterium atlanticum TaxID=2697563 RepID=UPI001422C475|nr:helix-turn-helix domain-containing protein [Brevibacterium atlanticum]
MPATTREYCGETMRATIDVVGGKWTMLVLWELLKREHRYADLQRQVAGISQKVLSNELKDLVERGLVDREVEPSVPPQVTYRITDEGRSLEPVFEVLHNWGREHRSQV